MKTEIQSVWVCFITGWDSAEAVQFETEVACIFANEKLAKKWKADIDSSSLEWRKQLFPSGEPETSIKEFPLIDYTITE